MTVTVGAISVLRLVIALHLNINPLMSARRNDVPVINGSVFVGDVEFEVRFTPGHTLGHCILYVATPDPLAPEERRDYSERRVGKFYDFAKSE